MDVSRPGDTVEPIEDDADFATVRTQFDLGETPPSMAVIATLAEMMDTDPAALDPLYASVDSDALNSLVPLRNGTGGDVHISFTHEAHEITVSSYGVVTISREREPPAGNVEGGAGR